MVVVLDPHIQLGLRIGDVGEHLAVHELDAHRLVPALDLAGRGRRPRPGEDVLDAVLPADPVKQHLTSPRAEAAGEHLAVVRQDLRRHPMTAHRQRERITRRTSCRPSNDVRRDAEPRVIINTRDDLRLAAVDEADATNDVHLPQLHRPRPLPTPIVVTLPFARCWGDQPVTHQTAIDRRQRRQR